MCGHSVRSSLQNRTEEANFLARHHGTSGDTGCLRINKTLEIKILFASWPEAGEAKKDENREGNPYLEN